MHESSIKRMEWFADKYLSKAETERIKVLDVGSYNVNGCYRNIFTDKGYEYKGLDMEDGPNVDVVPRNTYKWDEIETNSFDAVISGQALEHIEFFWLTVAEMVRVTKDGGLICIIAPKGFEEHRYPVDCWRFFTDGMIALARYHELEILHAHTNCGPTDKSKEWFSENEADTMLIAKKGYGGEARITDLEGYKCMAISHKSVRGDFKTYDEYLEKGKITKREDANSKNDRTRFKQKVKKLLSSIRDKFTLCESK